MTKRIFNHSGFNAYLSERQLMASRCDSCQAVFLPPRGLCTRCYSTLMAWEPLSGEGELIGYTTIHIAPPAMKAAGYSREKPYRSGIIRLKEGCTISGLIVDETTELRTGMPMRAVFVERNGVVLLGFDVKEE